MTYWIDPADSRRKIWRSEHVGLCERYRCGASTMELADLYGVRPEQIRRILIQNGITRRPAHRHRRCA